MKARMPRVTAGESTMSVSMLEVWRPYRWRDSARCSPARLAELAAHDDYIAALERLWGREHQLHRQKGLRI